MSLLDSDADFHQHAVYDETNEVDYSGSKGDLKAKGIGAYLTWNRDDGQYLDFIVRGSRLTNDYKFTDSDEQMYENKYSTWTYGTAFRYGWHKEMSNGWFLEPQTGLSWGRMKKYDYWQDNNMRYTQNAVDMMIGHLGVTAGKQFGSGEHKGTVYAKALSTMILKTAEKPMRMPCILIMTDQETPNGNQDPLWTWIHWREKTPGMNLL